MRLHEATRRYLIWLRAIGTSPRTFPTVESILRLFLNWAQAQGVTMIEQLTPELFGIYQQELTFRQNKRGRPLTITTQLRHLGVLRRFGRYLIEQDLLLSNPAGRLHLPRKPKALPRTIPNKEETVRLLEARRSDDLSTYRNQAILELLYSTGLRRSEVSNLDLSDLDLIGGYCWVREGKGRKDRVVPLGKVASERIQIYLDAIRPEMLAKEETGALFLNRFGRRLSGEGIYQVVKKAVVFAKLSRTITPHALRHAAATHMLQNGAPLRYLQEFLGHASVETTQIYTRITILELKAIHAKCHPREREAE